MEKDMTRQEAIEILKRWLNYMTPPSGEKLGYVERWVTKEDIKALKLAINSLETDEAYQLEYEHIKCVTTEQLEEMYKQFEKKLWSVREDVRGDDMIEVGFAEQFLQDLLAELGCWDREEE